jgi:hypothetical protein
LPHWLAQRRELRDVYLGRDCTDAIDAALVATAGVRRTGEAPVDGAARRFMRARSARSTPDAWNMARGL